MKNSDKLNYLIRKKSEGSNELSLHLHQMFFFEHILMRIEKSNYKDNIILKGGVLLSSIFGCDMRTTKDIDTTLKGIPLNEQSIRKILEDILSIDVNDGCTFKIISIKDIRLEEEYSGYRINVLGMFDKLKNYFFFEISTGDTITPREIKYKYNSIFEDREINIMAYNIETIIAEKFHAIISKNITTTRAKDFYDIYMLMNNHKNNINTKNLVKAIERTFKSRNSKFDIGYFKEIINLIANDSGLIKIFQNYKHKYNYTKNVQYKDTILAINHIIDILEKEIVTL